jgi:tetratricopeptide (TPR) repeat protein
MEFLQNTLYLKHQCLHIFKANSYIKNAVLEKKMLRFRMLFLGFLSLISFNALSQENHLADSLLTQLHIETQDTNTVNLLLEISEAYRRNDDSKAINYANQALELSDKISFYSGKAMAYKILGIMAISRDAYVEAREFFEKSRQIYFKYGQVVDVSDCLRKIGLTYVFQSNFEYAITHYEKSLELEIELDNAKGIADCYNDMGVIYNYQGNHSKSIEYQKKSLAVVKTLNDKKAIASRLINLGASYDDQSNYDSAITCYNEALQIKKELDDKRGISICLNNLGEVFNDKGDYGKAIAYYEQSLIIDTELDDKEGVAISLLNMGNLHENQANNSKALEYYEKSLQIAQEIENRRIIVSNQNHMGELYIKAKAYSKAVILLETAIRLSSEIGEDSELAKSYFFMGEAHLAQGKYNDAINEFQKALALHKNLGETAKMAADQIKIGNAYFNLEQTDVAIAGYKKGLQLANDIGSKENIRMAAELLAQAYVKKNEFDKAYHYSVLFKQIHDSIFTLESKQQISVIESRFELERKEQQIELQSIKLDKQEAEIIQQQIRQRALVGLVMASLLIGLLIVIGYLRIKKSNTIISKQMVLIEETNEELKQINEELKVTIEDNTQQKLQIEKKNKEITDSIRYANQIQQALMPRVEKLNSLVNQHSLFYKPKNIIGGDFYWASQIDKTSIVAVADSTGHGVPGALMSMLGISFLNEIVNKEQIIQPNLILSRLREFVIKAMNQEGKIGEHREGMDLAIVAFEKQSYKMHFSGAKMPAYIIRNSQNSPIDNVDKLEKNNYTLYELKGDKMPIAQYEKMTGFKQTTVELIPGDVLYLFTDGFADQFGGKNTRRLMYKPFKELLIDVAMLPVEQQNKALQTAFLNWQQNHEQIDDVLVMGIKIQ